MSTGVALTTEADENQALFQKKTNSLAVAFYSAQKQQGDNSSSSPSPQLFKLRTQDHTDRVRHYQTMYLEMQQQLELEKNVENNNSSAKPAQDISEQEASWQELFENVSKQDVSPCKHLEKFEQNKRKFYPNVAGALKHQAEVRAKNATNAATTTVAPTTPDSATKKKKEIILRVKRKREEEPMEEILLEVNSSEPKSKKQRNNLQAVTETLSKISMDNNNSTAIDLKRFTLLETSGEAIDPTVVKKISEKRNIKAATTPTKQDIQQKSADRQLKSLKTARLAQIKKLRMDDANVVDLDLETSSAEKPAPVLDNASLDAYSSLLEQEVGKEASQDLLHSNDGDYVYDIYYLNDATAEKADRRNRTIVKISNFNEDILLTDELVDEDDDDANDSGSNASDCDYPDEEDFDRYESSGVFFRGEYDSDEGGRSGSDSEDDDYYNYD